MDKRRGYTKNKIKQRLELKYKLQTCQLTSLQVLTKGIGRKDGRDLSRDTEKRLDLKMFSAHTIKRKADASNSSGLKSVYEKRRDRLEWRVGLSVEITLGF